MFLYSKLHNWWLKTKSPILFYLHESSGHVGRVGCWGVCIDYFAHGCDQVSDKKQLKGGRLYLSSGFKYYIVVGKAWWQKHKAACSHLGQSGSRVGLQTSRPETLPLRTHLPPARPHLLRIPQPPRTVPPLLAGA